MPFYEYQCQSCNEKVTLMQGIKDDPATVCPKCGKESLVRIISNTAFTLKGSGWFGKSSSHNHSSCACDNCPHKH